MDALKYIVTKALLQLGFTPGYNGFFFLRDAVIIARRDPEALTLITKLIYAPLAKAYGTTPENIEKSIRKAAEAVWKRNGGKEKTAAVLNTEYHYPDVKPENRELLSLICHFVEQAGEMLDTDVSNSI
jgi:spo0A protein, (cheY-like receiver domain and HTH-type DNA binding domain)